MQRRALILTGVAGGSAHALPKQRLAFPRDHGSHNDFRTEWWYVTGHLTAAGTDPQVPQYGFQVTFFRSRAEGAEALKSPFAARHILFAHAAVTDLKTGKLVHDQRIGRWGGKEPPSTQVTGQFASSDRMQVALGGWQLTQTPQGQLQTRVRGQGFAFELGLTETQELLLQGDNGLSRKGPQAEQASYYYSKPQLQVSGALELGRQTLTVTGSAWLDHEWSQSLLHPDAVGWDWVGMNLFDGSSVMGFQLRRANQSALYSGGAYRSPPPGNGPQQNPRISSQVRYIASNGEVVFSPQRFWKSPKSGANYPVEWLMRHPADIYTVRALADAQELDSRGSTGTIYWEGLAELLSSTGQRVGLGYLEMTGYAAPLTL